MEARSVKRVRELGSDAFKCDEIVARRVARKLAVNGRADDLASDVARCRGRLSGKTAAFAFLAGMRHVGPYRGTIRQPNSLARPQQQECKDEHHGCCRGEERASGGGDERV